jgi:hypothetical protein
MLTVKSLVRQLPLGMPKTQYYFCDAPGCDVVYFALEVEAPRFRRQDLVVRVGAKETADPIPVCYCFGFTRKSIEDEIAETGLSAIGERITRSQGRQLCLRSEKSLRQVLLGQRHADRSRLNAEFARRRNEDRWVAAVMENFWQAVRQSIRLLRSRPGFALTVVFTLALGIGANATIFTWIKAVLLANIVTRSDDEYHHTLGTI